MICPLLASSTGEVKAIDAEEVMGEGHSCTDESELDKEAYRNIRELKLGSNRIWGQRLIKLLLITMSF